MRTGRGFFNGSGIPACHLSNAYWNRVILTCRTADAAGKWLSIKLNLSPAVRRAFKSTNASTVARSCG